MAWVPPTQQGSDLFYELQEVQLACRKLELSIEEYSLDRCALKKQRLLQERENAVTAAYALSVENARLKRCIARQRAAVRERKIPQENQLIIPSQSARSPTHQPSGSVIVHEDVRVTAWSRELEDSPASRQLDEVQTAPRNTSNPQKIYQLHMTRLFTTPGRRSCPFIPSTPEN